MVVVAVPLVVDAGVVVDVVAVVAVVDTGVVVGAVVPEPETT